VRDSGEEKLPGLPALGRGKRHRRRGGERGIKKGGVFKTWAGGNNTPPGTKKGGGEYKGKEGLSIIREEGRPFFPAQRKGA